MPADIRTVTETFAVSSQLRPEDVASLTGRYVLLINNRPDGEETGQPCGEEIEAAARDAGLAYAAVPITGVPGAAEIASVREAVAAADGPVLAFCRSGLRSIVAWAAGEAEQGRTPDELRRLGADAGYDLGPPLQRLLAR